MLPSLLHFSHMIFPSRVTSAFAFTSFAIADQLPFARRPLLPTFKRFPTAFARRSQSFCDHAFRKPPSWRLPRALVLVSGLALVASLGLLLGLAGSVLAIAWLRRLRRAPPAMPEKFLPVAGPTRRLRI